MFRFRFWIVCAVLAAFFVWVGARAFLKARSHDLATDSMGADALRQERALGRSQHTKVEKTDLGLATKKSQQPEGTTKPSVSSLIQARKYEEARSTLVEQIKSSPEDETLIEELAFLLVDKLNEKEEARLLFQRLLELNPENSLALGLYNDLSSSQSAQDQAAEFLATQAERCHPCSDLRLVAAESLIEARLSDEATALLDSLGESSLLTESQARHLSSLYQRLNRTDLAHHWLKTAVELAGASGSMASENKSSSLWRKRDRAMLNQLANDSRHGI